MKFIQFILIALIIPIFLNGMNNKPMSPYQKTEMRSDCFGLFTGGALMNLKNIGPFKVGTFSKVLTVGLGSLAAKKLYLFTFQTSGEKNKQLTRITQK